MQKLLIAKQVHSVSSLPWNLPSFRLTYCCMRTLLMVIIIIWGAFIHPMGATLIQYAHTLMNRTPTITHSEQLA